MPASTTTFVRRRVVPLSRLGPQGPIQPRPSQALMQAHLPLADELAGLTVRIADLLLTHETVDQAVSALAQALKEGVPGALGQAPA
jgi:hypothetical protein